MKRWNFDKNLCTVIWNFKFYHWLLEPWNILFQDDGGIEECDHTASCLIFLGRFAGGCLTSAWCPESNMVVNISCHIFKTLANTMVCSHRVDMWIGMRGWLADFLCHVFSWLIYTYRWFCWIHWTNMAAPLPTW